MMDNPINVLRHRIEFLASGNSLTIFPDSKFDFYYLKERIYQYLEKGKFHEKEYIKALKEIEPLLIKIIQSKDKLINDAKLGIRSDGFPLVIPRPLTKDEKQSLQQDIEGEINCYVELYEIITDTKIHVKSDKNITIPLRKSKKKHSIFDTDKKPSKEQINDLINLVIQTDGDTDIEFLNLEKSPNAEEFFYSKDLNQVSRQIQFAATTYIVAFVFWWLNKNGYTSSIYTAFNCDHCLTPKGDTFKSGNIRATVSQRKADFEKAYTRKKPTKVPPVPIKSDIPQELSRLNWQLHDIFS